MSYPILKIPDYDLSSRRVVEIPFNMTVPAAGRNTLVSSLIPYGFRILRLVMIFDENALNNLRLRWFISTNAGTSATGPPAGDDITATESPTPYFIGNNVILTANINQDYPVDRHYIKLYAENTNAVAVVANCTCILQQLPEGATIPKPPTTTPTPSTEAMQESTSTQTVSLRGGKAAVPV
jgi:hypothetical protein